MMIINEGERYGIGYSGVGKKEKKFIIGFYGFNVDSCRIQEIWRQEGNYRIFLKTCFFFEIIDSQCK